MQTGLTLHFVTGDLMRCLHKVTQPAPLPRPASSVVFYAPAEQVKAHKYDARVRILSANLGQDVLNRYDAKNTPFYLDLALPRARKRLRQVFLLSEDFESLATVKGQGKFLLSINDTPKMRTRKHLEAAGGAFSIAQLAEAAPYSVNIKVYADVVREAYAKRTFIQSFVDKAKSLKEGDPLDEVLRGVMRMLDNYSKAICLDTFTADTWRVGQNPCAL